jgi:hypothetical protein
VREHADLEPGNRSDALAGEGDDEEVERAVEIGAGSRAYMASAGWPFARVCVARRS